MKKISLFLIIALYACSPIIKEKQFIYHKDRGHEINRAYFSLPKKAKKTLTYSLEDIPVSKTPFATLSKVDEFLLRATHMGLLYKSNRSNSFEPAIASYYSISKNKTHYEFTIKRNLCFSNGAPLTVDDVYASLALLTKFSLYKEMEHIFDGSLVYKSGADSIVFTIQTMGYDLQDFFCNYPIVPASSIEGVTHKKELWDRGWLIGAGAYYIKKNYENHAQLSASSYFSLIIEAPFPVPFTNELVIFYNHEKINNVMGESDIVLGNNLQILGLEHSIQSKRIFVDQGISSEKIILLSHNDTIRLKENKIHESINEALSFAKNKGRNPKKRNNSLTDEKTIRIWVNESSFSEEALERFFVATKYNNMQVDFSRLNSFSFLELDTSSFDFAICTSGFDSSFFLEKHNTMRSTEIALRAIAEINPKVENFYYVTDIQNMIDLETLCYSYIPEK